METNRKGKSALITGAGKGIGRAVAEQFAKEGMNLGIIARRQQSLDEVARQLTDTYSVRVCSASADVSNRAR